MRWTFIMRAGAGEIRPPSCFYTETAERSLAAALHFCDRMGTQPDSITLERLPEESPRK